MTVTDSDSASPQTISLSGTGIAVDNGSLTISPSPYDFGSVPTYSWTGWHFFTITNNGANPLTIQNVSVLGPFGLYNPCSGTLAPGTNCSIQIYGYPRILGKVNGEVLVTDSAGNHFAPLSVTGTSQTASLSPASLDFGYQPPNTSRASQPVTLVNYLDNTLVITGISASGPFTQTNDCGSAVAYGKTCTINVTFTPTATGPASGTLTVTDTDANGQQTVALSGIGGAPPGNFSLSATDAGVFAGGSGASTVTETITNGYNTPVTFSVSGLPAGVTASFNPTSLTGAGSTMLTFMASSTVVAGSSTITVIGTPASGTAQTTTLTLQVNAPAMPTTTVLSITPSGGSLTAGSAYTLTATVTPASGTAVPTGNVIFTIGSAPQTVALDSSGGATYAGIAPAVTGNLTISAAYQGSAAFATSNSNTITETITAIATTTTLTASPNPVTQGSQVTLTATVTPASGASPSGTVSFFYNGTTPIGSASVSGNSASLVTSSLPAGTDLLTATYGGSATFASSTSSVVSLEVDPSNTNPVPTIASTSPAFTSAGSATFTLTVNGLGFVPGSTVYWGVSAVTTQFVSATQLSAQIPAANVAVSGVSAITVQTPAPGGGISNTFQFEVDSAGSGTTAPVFTSTSASVSPGSTANYPVTLPPLATGVSVMCLNLPAGAGCGYSAANATLQVTSSSTTPAGTYQITAVFTETLPGTASAMVVLPFILGLLLMARRKKAAGSARLISCLAILALAGATMSIGCGAGSGSSPTSPTNPTHQITSSGVIYLTVQ